MVIELSRLDMPGWELVEWEASAARWRDGSGDVVSLTVAPVQSFRPRRPSGRHGGTLRLRTA